MKSSIYLDKECIIPLNDFYTLLRNKNGDKKHFISFSPDKKYIFLTYVMDNNYGYTNMTFDYYILIKYDNKENDKNITIYDLYYEQLLYGLVKRDKIEGKYILFKMNFNNYINMIKQYLRIFKIKKIVN